MVTPVSIIIPTLNESVNLQRLLPQLLALSPRPEIIISDGGSSDTTLLECQRFQLRCLSGPAGRGNQLNSGGDAAKGAILLFLHADSRLPAESYGAMLRATTRNPHLQAGAFRFSLADTPGIWPRIYERGVQLRNRLCNLVYGDQGFFLRREAWQRGYRFPEWPLMEDVEWWRRVSGELPTTLLEEPLITSARRFAQRGYLTSSIRNLSTMLRFQLGTDPDTLAGKYQK